MPIRVTVGYVFEEVEICVKDMHDEPIFRLYYVNCNTIIKRDVVKKNGNIDAE